MSRNLSKALVHRRRELKRIIREEKDLRTLGRRINDKTFSEGRANIDVDLSNAELYTPLSYGLQRQLNADIFEHIEQSANLLPSLVPLRVLFHGVSPDSGEQAEIRELFRRHYSAMMQDRLWDKRDNTRKMISMILIGIAFLALYLVLALNREDNLFLEILSVIGSFSLWEAASCFLVERKSIQRELTDIAQFMTAEVEFDGSARPM